MTHTIIVADGAEDITIGFDPLPIVKCIKEVTGDMPYVLLILNPDEGSVRQFSNGDVQSQANLLVAATNATMEQAVKMKLNPEPKH